MRAAYLSTLVAIVGLTFTASADAAVYKGSTVSREQGRASGDVALTVDNGQVTAFSADYYPVCEGGASTSGKLSLDGIAVPVAADGSATFGVRGTLFGYANVVAGTVTIRNALPDSPAVSGIVSGSGLLIESTCTMQRDFLAAIDVKDVKPTKTQFASDSGPVQVAFDRAANALHKLHVAGNFYCPGGGSFAWYAPARGVQRVKLSKYGAFTVQGYDTLESYGDAVRFTLKGRVTKRGASGTITIDARSFGRGDECAAIVQKWSSKLIRPVVPGPEFSAEIFALRQVAGGGYRYGIGFGRASCVGGATHIKAKVAGRSTTTSCAVARRRIVALVMGLRAGATYTLRARAVKVRRGRVVRSSPTSSESVTIPQPGSPAWERITG